jgi:tetratricopeptide (TPR) repeat protein
MAKHLLRSFVALSFTGALTITGAVALAPQLALAQTAAPAKAAQPQVNVRKEIAQIYKAAQELEKAGNLAGATAKTKEADAYTDQNPVEVFVLQNYLGYLAVRQQKYLDAKAAYDKALVAQGIDDKDRAQALQLAMTLYIQDGDYAKGIAYGERLAATGPLDARSGGTLALAYYQTKQYPKALEASQKALDAAKAAGEKPDPVLYQVIRNVYVDQGNQTGARQIVETEAADIGDPSALATLAGYAMSTKGLGDHLVLQTFRFLNLIGKVPVDSYATMGSLSHDLGFPQEAVNVLQKGADAGATGVGAALAQAKAKVAANKASIPELERTAKASPKGEVSVKLGETYWTYGRNDEAVAAIKAGIAKGGVDNVGDAQIMLGIVLLDQDKNAEALDAFRQAESNAKAQPVAHLWTLYTQNKTKSAQTPAPAGAAPAAPPG